jgi:hypothetical protein
MVKKDPIIYNVNPAIGQAAYAKGVSDLQERNFWRSFTEIFE